MTTDEIIKLASEADRWATNQTSDTYEWKVLRDERFATLVATFEREECAKVCEYRAMALDYNGNQYVRDHAALDCARSIRARGIKS